MTDVKTIEIDLKAARDWVAEHVMLSSDYDWMINIFVVLFFTAVASFVVGMILRTISNRLSVTRNQWDDLLLDAAIKPVKLLIWLLGISYAVEEIYEESRAEIFRDISELRDIALVLTIAWALNRFIHRGKNHYVKSKRVAGEKYDETAVQAITKLLKITVVITAVLITLQNLGVSISGILAFGGVGGIAVGFAAKDMLANFFGALIIYFDKPFKVGDWIRSPDQNIEGTVEEIGWRMTTIRTFDKRPLYVPNSVFTTISVENPSRMSHRRIYETIGIRYDDIGVMQDVTDRVRLMLREHEGIAADQTLLVYFNAFNASSCDFMVYCFTQTTDWKTYHEIKHDVLLKIAEIVEKADAEMAFPTQTIHVANLAEAGEASGAA